MSKRLRRKAEGQLSSAADIVERKHWAAMCQEET